MATIELLLERLASLSYADRQWILQRLPDELKEKLIDTGDSLSDHLDSQTQGELTPVSDQLMQLDPRQVAQVLSNEPAWVGAVVLKGADTTWRDQVLKSLPNLLRSTIMMTLQSQMSLSEVTRRAIRNALAARARAALPMIQMTPVKSRWEQLQSAWGKWRIAS